MHPFFEAIFVGCYTYVIYTLVSFFQIKNIYVVLCITGFMKHYIAYYSGLHTYYCNNGYACKDMVHSYMQRDSNDVYKEAIIEGILFVCIGSILLQFMNKNIVIFMVPFILHIAFEVLGIHGMFCRYLCV